jgi:hypothetical protein
MLLSKFQSSVGLILISGAVLIILTYFIIKPAKTNETKEGFKGQYTVSRDTWIVTENKFHKQNNEREKKRHQRSQGKLHVAKDVVKNDLKKLIKSNPEFIQEVGEVISDNVISNTIDKTIKSKPILNKVHDVIATPKITRQIEDIIKNDPSHKKMHNIANQMKFVKNDIKKTISNDMLKIQRDIKKDIKKVKTDIQKNVEKAVKKIEVKRQVETAKQVPKDTPYERILRAHNKLTDKNANIIEQKRKNLAEIRELRKQIEKTESTQKVNNGETSKLAAEVEAVNRNLTKAVKELKENKILFTALVKDNLRTYDKLTEEKNKVRKDKKVCEEQTKEVNRLKVRLESTNSEKLSAADSIKNLNEQLKASQANESLSKVLKGQIEQLEKTKLQLDRNHADLVNDLQKEVKVETDLKAKIKKGEMDIKSIENGKIKLEKQIADANAKNKMEQEAVIALGKEIEDAKNRMGVKNRTNTLLENELANLRKQHDKLSLTATGEEKQLKELENDSVKNKQTIAELQVVIKSLQLKPKGFPIGNWDFTKGSLKDQNNKYQSETVGNVPFETFQGKRAAVFKEQNHIKIVGSISTNDFKSVTMMINVQSNPGPWPRIWEFTNSNLGGSWCADSVFGVLNPSNNIGFYSMKDCNGPAIWSNKGDLPRGTWQHCAFVYNDKMDEMKLYVNGKQTGHWSEPGNKRFQNKTYSGMYIMQCVERFNKNAAVAWFRIFDYSMKEEDITKDMNNGW